MRRSTLLLGVLATAALAAVAGVAALGPASRGAPRVAALPAAELVPPHALVAPPPAPSAAAAEPAARPEAAALTGRVVGGTAEERGGLAVLAQPAAGHGPPRSVSCAPDGSFVLDELEPGTRYRLWAVPAGGAAFARARTRAVEALAGGPELELPLLREAALTLSVADARTGAALTDFEVRLGRSHLRPLLDADARVRRHFPAGRVRCTGLLECAAGESFALVVAAPGHEEVRLEGLFVPPGAEVDLGTVRLARAPRLHVRVLDAAHAPVARARVRLRPAAEADAGERVARAFDGRDGRTDADGDVLLSSLPGVEAVLTVVHPAHAPLARTLVLPEAEEHQLTVVLPARAH